MENNTIIENENILNNNENEHMHNNLDHNNLNLNMGNGEENMNLNNITGEENRDEGDGDMKDDLLDSTMENDNRDGDGNDLNDELLNEHNIQNNTINEDNNNHNDHYHHDDHNIHNNQNENKTISEDNHNHTHQHHYENNNHHTNNNENTTLIHGSILSPTNNLVSQTNNLNNDVKNEFNKRNIELEVEQLTKQRRLLEEERRRISDQIQFLENEEDDEPPELTLSQCNTIINKLKKTHESIIWPFLEPVDHVKHGLIDYLDIIKTPMDLGTIAIKIKKKEYASYYGFVADLNLVWDNCILYNTEYTDIGRWAVDLRESCKSLISEALKKKAGDKKKSFGAKPKTASQVDEVKSFLEKIRSDPTILKQPKLQFFKDFLTTFDVNKI